MCSKLQPTLAVQPAALGLPSLPLASAGDDLHRCACVSCFYNMLISTWMWRQIAAASCSRCIAEPLQRRQRAPAGGLSRAPQPLWTRAT